MTPSSGWRHLFAGSTFAITIVVFVFVGVWVDKKWAHEPWGVLGCTLIGVVLATMNLIKEFKDES